MAEKRYFFVLPAFPGMAFSCYNEKEVQKNKEAEMSFSIHRNGRLFLGNTTNMSYAFEIREDGRAVNLHWGGRIHRAEDLPPVDEISFFSRAHYSRRVRQRRLEYSFYTPGDPSIPCLKLHSPDRAVELLYDGFRLENPDHLVVTLRDRNSGIRADLHYLLYPEFDLIARHAEIIKEGDGEVCFESLFSAVWSLPRGNAPRLTTLQGEWGQEYRVHRTQLLPGEYVLESRNGISGHSSVPFFAFDPGNADERSGEIHFGTLLWSGDWKFIFERDAFSENRVSGGINSFDFKLRLAGGEHFETPVFLAGFTRGGFGAMSRQIHRYSAACLAPAVMRKRVLPVVFNTYSCIRGPEVTEKNVLELIPRAAEVGCELFIIDAGWQTSMGDWEIHPEKFPGGFRKIIRSVQDHGMKFGIWMEFERVDSASRLYREHPEWRIDSSSYSLLDLSRGEVLEYLHGVIFKLLKENEIVYFKMDLNRYLEIPDVPARREMRTRYMLNFYELMSRLNEEFPHVFFENCASGSGRGDLAMDRYFSRINRSDNQDTLDILDIQEGFTYLHHPKSAGGGCQISRSYSYFFNHREIPLRFMAHAAMMGWPSLGIPLNRSSEEELKECRAYLDLNRKIRHVVAFGELYRLASHRENRYAAFEYVLPDRSEALLFVFAHALQFAQPLPNLHLEGLDPDAVYTIERYGQHETERDAFCNVPEPDPYPVSGRGLAEIGILVALSGDLDSRILHLRKR